MSCRGINLHQYGRGEPNTSDQPANFWELLRFLDRELSPQWQGKARLRISSLEPSQLNQYGLETLQSCKMLCPHVHLSLQSGSSQILRMMGRGHCRLEPLMESVLSLRKIWPEMGLGADILMGFPGEEEHHVQETLHMDRIWVLQYLSQLASKLKGYY